MHHDRQAVHLALKEGEKGVGDTGGHGRQKCHHQREGVRLKAGAEHDKGTHHGKCQRRDLDLGQLFFHKNDSQNGDPDRGSFVQDRHIALRRMAGGIKQGDQAQKAKERPPEQIGLILGRAEQRALFAQNDDCRNDQHERIPHEDLLHRGDLAAQPHHHLHGCKAQCRQDHIKSTFLSLSH